DNLSNTTPQYNGNISAMLWKTEGDDVPTRGYGFGYDGLNRLTDAHYGEGLTLESGTGKYSMSVPDYDANGNIKKLNRYFRGIKVDELTYTYENNNQSNRLLSVADDGTSNSNVKDYDAISAGTYT
ncbi:hypothetical protein, partial [Plebeiibacterium marinum]